MYCNASLGCTLYILMCTSPTYQRDLSKIHPSSALCVFAIIALPPPLLPTNSFPYRTFPVCGGKKTSYETKKVPVTVRLIHQTPRQRWPAYGLISVQSWMAQIMCITLWWNGFESMAKQKWRDEKTRADARSPQVWNISLGSLLMCKEKYCVLLRLTCWPCMADLSQRVI